MSKFTQRHYEALAHMIRSVYESDVPRDLRLDTFQHLLSEHLLHDNPNFSPLKFRSACMPREPEEIAQDTRKALDIVRGK